MDSNSKLWPSIIPDDPHPQSSNGKLLESVIKENNLKVLNGSSICSGTITRQRTTINSTEKSIIDHFIVCADMYGFIVKLQIDEQRKYCLTKFTNKTWTKTCTKESDHNTLILEINKNWFKSTNYVEKGTEILNFKNEQNFETFVEITNNSDELKKCFIDENEDLENASKAWLKCIKLILKASFTKIRLKKSSLKPQLQLLFKERESLKTKIALLENKKEYHDIHIQQNNLDDVNRKISDLCAERNKIIVNEYLGKTDDTI